MLLDSGEAVSREEDVDEAEYSELTEADEGNSGDSADEEEAATLLVNNTTISAGSSAARRTVPDRTAMVYQTSPQVELTRFQQAFVSLRKERTEKQLQLSSTGGAVHWENRAVREGGCGRVRGVGWLADVR